MSLVISAPFGSILAAGRRRLDGLIQVIDHRRPAGLPAAESQTQPPNPASPPGEGIRTGTDVAADAFRLSYLRRGR
jgi:hypothetical protein